jgi:hypothetical protein
MGSLKILEQYEHVNCDFNLSIFEVLDLIRVVFSLDQFNLNKKKECSIELNYE